ncbi:hypothetical protein PHLGIDRAFT_98571 [Phlebiopsis gigantea 11061_1 CR5-6]|uniref:DUF6534 domain-containing protein n=1 Tax=Phlebiopsis gigantea (strain 11061_1 CR5-6) TaxID=745531 RepID=A0A0C3SFJ3_PHLG1|nr:hypothetical protein PHLGIDRAFT_98571 [Phlebiopsis gigantea 11061_1 CR5-6]
MLNWGLFGALSIQVYWYYVSFPHDGRLPKYMVYGIYVIEFAQTVLVSHDAFTAYAKFYGNLNELNAMQNEWLTVPVMSSIVSCSVQMYYAYRLFILTKSWLLVSAVCAIAVTQATAGIIAGVQAFLIGNFSGLASKAFASEPIWLAGSAACDVIIAVSMAYFLLSQRTQVTETRAIIMKLVHVIVETGALTATAAVVDISLYFGFPHNNYHACVALVLAKLYSNSLLVLFNTRARVVGGRNWTPDVIHELRRGGSAPTQQVPVSLSARSAASSLGGVHVHEEIWVNTDDMEMHERASDKMKRRRSLSEGM